MTLRMLAFSRVLSRLAAAERMRKALGRLLTQASGPEPLDVRQLSPYWLRDLGLPEDLSDRVRLERW